MPKELFEKPARIAIFLIVLGLIAFFLIGFFGAYLPETVTKNAALAGWLSGTIGTFTSVAALCLLFYTYKTQKEELDSTKQQMINQNATIAQQKFETTFFNLINLFRETAKQFNLVLPEIKKHIDERISLMNLFSAMKSDGNELTTKYMEVKNLPQYHSELSRYFRVLHYVLDFIDANKDIDAESKKTFHQLVETTMTDEELFITFFECSSRGFGDSFTRTVKSADLLTNYLQYRKHRIPTTMRDYYILYKAE